VGPFPEHAEAARDAVGAQQREGVDQVVDSLALEQVAGVQDPCGAGTRDRPARCEVSLVDGHGRDGEVRLEVRERRREFAEQEPRDRGHTGGPREHPPGRRAPRARPVEQPDVAAVAGHDERRVGGECGEQPAGEPPVRVHDRRAEPARLAADGGGERGEERGHAERDERRPDRPLVQVAAVAHALQPFGRVPEPAQRHAGDHLLGRRARGVRREHSHVGPRSGGRLGEPRDERARRVAREPRVVVRDHEYAHFRQPNPVGRR
jgi:hypothetical protein